MDMKELIAKVADGKDLTEEEARRGMEILLGGEATQAQIGAFLTALRMKGETLEELVGFASVLRDKAETIKPAADNYVDLVGTGGDCTYTFNISTTSAFVVAAAGLPVRILPKFPCFAMKYSLFASTTSASPIDASPCG